MWLVTGFLFSVFIHECVPQGTGFRGSGGFSPSAPPSAPRGGFMGGPMGTDVMVRTRGDRFGSGGQIGGDSGGIGGTGSRGLGGTVDRGLGGTGSGGLGGTGSGECTPDRRIAGFSCMTVTDCPSDSRCIRDRTSGGSYCCWERSTPVEAPCEDPRMREDGRSFMQCVPGNSTGCPQCHRCQSLGGGMGMGLCCPQVTVPGCERSSPMRNEFEAARRRIAGSGGSMGTSMGGTSMGGTSMGTSMGTGSRLQDSRVSDRFSRDRMGPGSSPLGTDFGMTRSSSGIEGEGRVLCPNGLSPLRYCSSSDPCPNDYRCLEISGGRGGCCPRGLSGTPGLPGRTDGSGRFMPGSAGRPGMSDFPGGPTGVVSGMSRRDGVCPDGLPGTERCFSRGSCGPGQACVPVRSSEGVCCPTRPGGMPRGPGRFGPGGPGGPEMPRFPGMTGRLTPMEMLERRRAMRRALARRRMLGLRRPFGEGARF